MFIKEALKLELKAVQSHLRYVFLGDGTLPDIIAADLSEVQVEALSSVLKRFKRQLDGLLQTLLGFLLAVVLKKSTYVRPQA